jgi:hypothetical protein
LGLLSHRYIIWTPQYCRKDQRSCDGEGGGGAGERDFNFFYFWGLNKKPRSCDGVAWHPLVISDSGSYLSGHLDPSPSLQEGQVEKSFHIRAATRLISSFSREVYGMNTRNIFKNCMFKISKVHNLLTVNKGNIIRDPIRVKNFRTRINSPKFVGRHHGRHPCY